ncbi:MAG TPA: beta-N-acetylhexosaminidase [Puia sp.]|nr:beta-N-acetylhexosaminidase [Puia sp.]
MCFTQLSKVLIISAFVVFSTGYLKAQNLNLIPYPSQVQILKGTCVLNNALLYTNNKGLSGILHYQNDQMGSQEKNKPRQLVELKIQPSPAVYGSYELITSEKGVAITASDTAGLFNGVVTLIQLIQTYDSANQSKDKLVLPRLVIHDHPRYAWRGFMLDESRHFFGKEIVKQLLDWMAFYKLNRFHWHLSDSQGWRIEIKKYPLLTSVGGKGNFTDSLAAATYYTQDDIREIVAYAKDRFITIIPEIDMPGHATAATRAYPILSGGDAPNYPGFTFDPAKDETYTYLTNILKELRTLFPSGIIHLGGDEVAFGIAAWSKNSGVAKLMAANQFTELNQVEHYFLRRMADSVLKFSNDIMCWDEAVSAGLPVSRTYVSWWRQNHPESLNEAISKGYKIVLCPRLPMYLDFVQDSTHQSGRKWDKTKFNSYLDLYHFPENSIAADVYGKMNILGIQGNLWTETVSSKKRLQYLIFPRMAALAEAGWTAASAKNDEPFNTRLKAHLILYNRANIYYYNPFQPDQHPEAIDVRKRDDD